MIPFFQPEGTFRSCHLTEYDVMFYDFYYDISMGSSQSDINFWLRITTGPGKLNFFYNNQSGLF